jgi:predicted acyltransferase (DUF342 family)
VRASTVQIGDGAQVEGDIVAQELTIGGCVKGTIRANRVKLNSTAMVDGDIYHRSLAIERMRNSGEGHDDRKAGHQRQRTGQGPNGWPGLRASAGRVERWQPEDQWCP